MRTTELLRISAAAGLLVGLTGCFSARSFPLETSEIVRVPPPPAEAPASGRSTRDWLAQTHPQLAKLLPTGARPALLTADLTDASGRPVDVLSHFGVDPNGLRTVVGNYSGLENSAAVLGGSMAVEKPAPSWPGFEQVWIPVSPNLKLSGRLGFARANNETILDADCLVVLGGLFGDFGVQRSRDLAEGLRSLGFHVLVLEMRGHGQTEARYPQVHYMFGVWETEDLMRVSDWLEDQPHIRRTGLMGFCWGGNHALLAAWYDGRSAEDESIIPELRAGYPPPSPRRRYRAGVIAFSPALRWEELTDQCLQPASYVSDPVVAGLQSIVQERMQRKQYPEVSGNLRNLIKFEGDRTGMDTPERLRGAYRFVRLWPYKGESSGDKFAPARIPVLIVYGANDPMGSAQQVADLFAIISNPNVAAVILPGGGHIGFAAYSKAYYFSLIANFFDPASGPAPQPLGPHSPAAAPQSAERPAGPPGRS